MGRAGFSIHGFIRDTTDSTSAANKEVLLKEGGRVHNSVGLFELLDPRTKEFSGIFENVISGNIMAVSELEPGHVYEVGVRIRTTGTAFQIRPFPAHGAGNLAYLEGDHENPAGDVYWGVDNIPDNFETNGHVDLSSVTIHWEERKQG